MDENQKKMTYAAYSLDESERMLGSSGGIYGLMAKRIISAGGTVFAVCYDEKFEAAHRQIETEEELPASFGSKYIQSRLGDTFLRIKECLQNGRIVLFTGTPCQTAGLLSFLGADYDNLIVVDFACHGVPSRTAWRRWIADHGLSDNLIALNMRDKSSGWSRYSYSWSMATKDGKRICVPQFQVSFMKGFTQDLYLRPSCYECRFKGIDRKSDITLGDFWGVWDEAPDMDDNKGTSAVLIHTEKGRRLFESVKDAVNCRKVFADAVVNHNPSITVSAKLTKSRKKFFEGLNSGADFDELVEKCCQETAGGRLKRMCSGVVKKFLNWQRKQGRHEKNRCFE